MRSYRTTPAQRLASRMRYWGLPADQLPPIEPRAEKAQLSEDERAERQKRWSRESKRKARADPVRNEEIKAQARSRYRRRDNAV